MLGLAIYLAADAYKDRKDKSGEPYILHCLRVMNNLHTRDKELQCIAILHDVMEDGFLADWQLEEVGFSKRVVDGVKALTHDRDDSYMEYIKKLSTNEDARLVKLADLKDNSDVTRLKGLTKKDFDRMEKYHTAYTYLSNV